jgi:RNase adapter protein RapZ
MTQEQKSRPSKVVLVTGMSGAGRSTALKALEDLSYEAIDNLPLSLLGGLVRLREGPWRPLAVGLDVRTRDFGIEPFLSAVERLAGDPGVELGILFLECEDETLRRRFTETRRRHPLATDRPVLDGIRHERRLLAPLRSRADVVLDTSELTAADLKRLLAGHYRLDAPPGPVVLVTSFSYRMGLPREADLVFDTRFLANPHYETNLRPLDGRHADVGAYIEADPDFSGFMASLETMLLPLIPRFTREGKSYLTIAIGCTGGRHRSVFTAERLARRLRAEGIQVNVAHRDLGQGELAQPAATETASRS